MLVSSVIDLILLQLAEDTSAPNYISRAQALEYINSCQRILAKELHCYTRFGWIRCLANKPKYTLDPALEQLQFVRYDSEEIPPESLAKWEKSDSRWRTLRGSPESYALDIEKKHVLWLNPCPDTDGDQFIFNSTTGVPYAIVQPWSITFDAQVQDFTVGQAALGGTSGAGGTILYVDQNGYSGTLYFESDPGTFIDNEAITDALGGSATVTGTTTAGGLDTWRFTRTYGLVESIGGGTTFWDLIDEDGEEVESGVIDEVWSPTKNLIYKYSYFPEDLTETDHIKRPYRNEGELFRDFTMYYALLIEAEGQDIPRAVVYAQEFARRTGVNLTGLWSSQKTFPTDPPSTSGKVKGSPRYPADWPAVER